MTQINLNDGTHIFHISHILCAAFYASWHYFLVFSSILSLFLLFLPCVFYLISDIRTSLWTFSIFFRPSFIILPRCVICTLSIRAYLSFSSPSSMFGMDNSQLANSRNRHNDWRKRESLLHSSLLNSRVMTVYISKRENVFHLISIWLITTCQLVNLSNVAEQLNFEGRFKIDERIKSKLTQQK